MNLMEKINYKVKKISVKALIKISLVLKMPKFTSLSFWLASTKINNTNGPVVLCLERNIFIDDIFALTRFSGRINYVTIHRHYFKELFYYFVRGEEGSKLTEENYHTANTARFGRDRYKKYLKRMLPYLKKAIGFEAIMACNFGYVEHQELALVCEESKIPFIVLNKEGMVASEAYDDFVRQFRGRKFIGTKMLCVNKQIKRALLDFKLPGLTEEKIVVTGVPRLDNYVFISNNKPLKQVTLFSFLPEDKFRYLKLNLELNRKISQISERFHTLFMDFALKHNDFKVIIKTKAPIHYVDYVEKILRKNFNENIPNLTITNAGDPFELIKDSVAIAGFNSTTMIEAMIANKIIIAPSFSDILSDGAGDYFKRYSQLVNYANDEKDLEDCIFKKEKHLKYINREKEEFLESFTFRPNGQASRRTEEAIIKVLTNYKS